MPRVQNIRICRVEIESKVDNKLFQVVRLMLKLSSSSGLTEPTVSPLTPGPALLLKSESITAD